VTAAELERLAREQRAALLACARRRARTHEDAEDAVQQALTIAFGVRERIRAGTALAYIGTIARHEAIRVRAEADRQRSLDQPLSAATQLSALDVLADPGCVDADGVIDTLAALRDAKPDHARALMARALGWRYAEICEAFGWSYTKTNRCVTEGHAAVRAAASPP
jgi:DNA-directed RNA polymerase specialized sigma24 family protein